MAEDRLTDEEGRVAALHRYNILGDSAEAGFTEITRLVQMALNVPIAAISLIDHDRQVLKSLRGMAPEHMARSAALGSYVITRHQPFIVPDAADDAHLVGIPEIGAYLGVPLTSPDGYNIGVICAMDTMPRDFDAEQVAMLIEFAKLVMEQVELRQIGERDALTGALTRRGFYQEVEREFVRASRYDRPTSLLFFDIDHFRKINDAFGHEAGDEAIQALAGKCIEVSRQTDSFGRIGGQEFAFLLPETNAAEAMQCAERMREVVEKVRFRTPAGVMSVTASFGVSTLSPGFVNAAQWFAETDVALYEAKRRGRNCSVLAAGPKLNDVRQDGNGTIEAAAATIIH